MPRAIALYVLAAALILAAFSATSSFFVWLALLCAGIAAGCFADDARERRHSRHLLRMSRRRRRARRGYMR